MNKDNKSDIVSIFFGDSITYGIRDDKLGGWVNRIRLELEKRNNNNFVLNLGIPGQTSNDILNRLENELSYRFNNIDKFNVIFSFGIKDSLILNNENNYLNVFNDNLHKLLLVTKKYTKNIYFIGVIVPNIKIRKNYNLDNVLRVDDCLESVCNQNNIKYIKIRDLITNDDLYDGLHPNANGHKKISEVILKNIFDYQEKPKWKKNIDI